MAVLRALRTAQTVTNEEMEVVLPDGRTISHDYAIAERSVTAAD